MRQYVTLSGLGTEEFTQAVHGMGVIYQYFNSHVSKQGGTLRPWNPAQDCYGGTPALTFSNHYLTSIRDADEETHVDLGEVVDPLNVLRPLVKREVHTQDNVVEYWQQSTKGDNM